MKDRINQPWLWILAVALAWLSCYDVHAGTATVTCTPPTKNVDGSTLTSLAGYRFYYGNDASSLTKFVQVANPGTCVNTFTLADGQWFFAVTAYTSAGAESVDSSIVSKTISSTPTPLTPMGPYVYEPTGTATAPTMSAIGLLQPGATCGTSVRQIGTTKFCQITRAQADLIGWPADKTLAQGVWVKAQ